jgi:Zn finger protein HypA/HybF involved in hydrogenase expression
MSEAYQCDSCGEFREGRRAGSVVEEVTDYERETLELCPACIGQVLAVVKEDGHRLDGARPDSQPAGAPWEGDDA